MLPILGIAGASMVSSCEQQQPYEPAPAEVDLFFDYYNQSALYTTSYNYEPIPSDVILFYIDHPNVKTINMVPTGDWSFYDGRIIIARMRPALEMLLNLSPKVHGKGDFNFFPGVMATSPTDSLWLVENGWTINKDLQNQR